MRERYFFVIHSIMYTLKSEYSNLHIILFRSIGYRCTCKKEMTFVKRKKINQYSSTRIFLCIIIGCSLPFSIFILKYSQSSTCVPRHVDDGIIDQQDDWKYQNSITGEWHYWRTIYKKQNNDTEWRVKWLNIAPISSLGVIVYLTTRNELDSLNKSLLQLSRLLSNNPRPVVIFHEGDLGDNDTQEALAKTLGSRTPLAFERIQFSNTTKGYRLPRRRSRFKYMNMCRFFILMLPNHPLLTLFSFYWRLDAHSYIFAPEPIKDPFEIMQKKQIQYAFVMADVDSDSYTTDLWTLFHNFINRHCIKPSLAVRETQTGWFGGYSRYIFFTNFAIANVSFFRDHPFIRAWLDRVDRNGGIYRYRWGDAPIHTLALTQFIPRDQILRLRYFGYMHRREYVCASGVEGDSCKQYVQRYLTYSKITYDNYDDGCAPTIRNPLCHYYPELRQ